MKRKVYIILAALLGIGNMSEAVAQDTKNILPGVSIEKFHMNREGKYLTMEMEVDLTALDVDANRAVLLTPRLVNGADSLDLPAIGIYGRRRYYYYVRNGISAISGESEKSFQVSKKPEQLEYDNHILYEEWMDGAALKFHRSDWGCCPANTGGIRRHHRPSSRGFLPRTGICATRSGNHEKPFAVPARHTSISRWTRR